MTGTMPTLFTIGYGLKLKPADILRLVKKHDPNACPIVVDVRASRASRRNKAFDFSERAYAALLGMIDPSVDWTQIDVVAFAHEHGPKAAHAAIRRLERKHYGEVVLIPTSRAWADPQRGSPVALAYKAAGKRRDIRYYYRDSATRWISHVQAHRAILRREGKTP